MKKYLCLILAAAMIFSLASCGTKGSSADGVSGNTDGLNTDGPMGDSAIMEEQANQKEETPEIESQEIYNDNNIVITATDMKILEDGDASLKLAVENNNESQIEVEINVFTLNGLDMDCENGLVFADPGQTYESEVLVPSAQLEWAGITDISEIDLICTLYDMGILENADEEDYDEYGILDYSIGNTGTLTIKGNVDTKAYEPGGEVAFSSDELTIQTLGMTPFRWFYADPESPDDVACLVYMQNTSENKAVLVSLSQAEAVVNGTANINDAVSYTIPAGHARIGMIHVSGTELESSGIAEVTGLDATLHVNMIGMDYLNYQNPTDINFEDPDYSSDEVAVSFQ